MLCEEHVRYLRCPMCKSDIGLSHSTLVCTSCRHCFEIRNGIPIFSELGDEHDLAIIADFVKQLDALPESECPDVGKRFLLPNFKYSLAKRCSENKTFKGFFSRFSDLSHLRILDLSCGVGREAQILIEGGATDLHLLDLSYPAVEYAKCTLEKYYPDCNLHCIVGDACHLPYSEQYFDVALVYASVHHYPDLNQFIDEVSRVSKNVCLLAEPAQMGPVQWIIDWVGWNTEYGSLDTLRLNEEKLVECFSAKGMTCETERMFQYYPKLLDVFGNNESFVKVWFAFLNFLDIVLPKGTTHCLNLFANKCG